MSTRELAQESRTDRVVQSVNINTVNVRTNANPAPPGRPATLKPVTSGLAISEPVTHEKLTVYFISGSDFQDTSKILSLDQAMEKKQIKVHETGSVNQLSVENLAARKRNKTQTKT